MQYKRKFTDFIIKSVIGILAWYLLNILFNICCVFFLCRFLVLNNSSASFKSKYYIKSSRQKANWPAIENSSNWQSKRLWSKKFWFSQTATIGAARSKSVLWMSQLWNILIHESRFFYINYDFYNMEYYYIVGSVWIF